MESLKIFNLQKLNFLQNASLKIGVLGGSFDPSHIGHLAISSQAIKYYKFDYIIWLVANQNPHKTKYINHIYLRAKNALAIAIHPKIIISTLERDLNCYYSYDSLSYLVKKFTKVKFTWLMGIDCVNNFRKWHRSEEIQNLCDIIIFDRPGQFRLLNIETLGLNTSKNINKAKLAKIESPHIIIHRGVLCDLSSTILRNNKLI